MAGICKVTLIGNLGGDPEMRYTAAGKPFTTFSVACNRNYTTADGEKHEETEWFRATANGRLAEVCAQYLSKGRRVYLEGRLSSRTFEGSDGQKRFSMQVNVTEMQIVDSKREDDGGHGGYRGSGEYPGNQPDADYDLDSIPF